MWCVITGDVVRSQSQASGWLSILKSALAQLGQEGYDWEVFRGDSFQLLVPAREGMRSIYFLRAALRSHEGLDVRIGIGLGEVSSRAFNVSESQGSAFIHSGEAFDSLGKTMLKVRSTLPSQELLQAGMGLIEFVIQTWSPAMASAIHAKLERPKLTQMAIAEELGVAQSYISAVQKRAGLKELLQFEEAFKSMTA